MSKAINYTGFEDDKNLEITVKASKRGKYTDLDFYYYIGKINGIERWYPLSFTRESGFDRDNPPSAVFKLEIPNDKDFMNIGPSKKSGEYTIYIKKLK